MRKAGTDDRSDRSQEVEQSHGGVYIEGDVSRSNVAGRDFFQQVYSTLPVPEFVQRNAKPLTIAYVAICEFLAIIATVADIRRLQSERFPPLLTPGAWQENLPLPTLGEILGLLIRNSILFFGLGVLVAIGLIAALWYIQNQDETSSASPNSSAG